MFASVRRYEGTTDTGEAGRRVEEGFVSIISQVPGFVAYYFIDAGDGVMVSMSVYENQAGADESNELAREWVARTSPRCSPTRRRSPRATSSPTEPPSPPG